MKNLFFLPIFAIGLLLTGLGFSQVAIAQSNQEDLENWQPTPEQQQSWDEDLISQSFTDWFAGIELTPAQEKFAKAENARYYYKFQKLGDRVEAEGREILTDAEARELETEFFQRLKTGLTKDQIKQVKANMEQIGREARGEVDVDWSNDW